MRGWDYLVATLARAVRNDTFSLRPLDWMGLTDDNVMLLFQSEDGKTTLTEPGVRASLIRDIGSVMSGEGWTSLRDLYRLSCQKALSGGNAFFVSLERFRAYRDPVRKKSLYLVALLQACCHWAFLDAPELPAPVDYHEVRGHLRLGTVCVHSQELLRKIREYLPVTDEEDVAIRSAVQQAISRIADCLGSADATTLHYLFWNLFRNVCRRTTPQCTEVRDISSLPERYRYLVELGGPSVCPFLNVCSAYHMSQFPVEHLNGGTIWY